MEKKIKGQSFFLLHGLTERKPSTRGCRRSLRAYQEGFLSPPPTPPLCLLVILNKTKTRRSPWQITLNATRIASSASFSSSPGSTACLVITRLLVFCLLRGNNTFTCLLDPSSLWGRELECWRGFSPANLLPPPRWSLNFVPICSS